MSIDIEQDPKWYDGLNVAKTCARYRVSIWKCPQFLFVIMGFLIAVAIMVTYQIARTTKEPEIAALIVLATTGVLFSIGSVIVNSFERIALSSLSKSEFISIISHQLRSPLSAIKWQINMLLGDHAGTAMLPAETVEYVEGIAEQNERMIRSVNDLLEVNRIEDNDLVLKPMEFSIPALTEKIVQGYGKFASLNNVHVSILVQQDIPVVYADEERIKRVLEHLVDNAIRYSLSGGEIAISIENSPKGIGSPRRGRDEWGIWKITDQGAGIPPKDQRRVFEKFFRSDNVMRYKTLGSGVGLFIARAIVKMSGGDIGFSSKANQGSML